MREKKSTKDIVIFLKQQNQLNERAGFLGLKNYFSKSREMTIFCISLVPSPMVQSLLSL